jgi:TPP-dependent pyruvate/acetoin dehydrogenase alpha subunit
MDEEMCEVKTTHLLARRAHIAAKIQHDLANLRLPGGVAMDEMMAARRGRVRPPPVGRTGSEHIFGGKMGMFGRSILAGEMVQQ